MVILCYGPLAKKTFQNGRDVSENQDKSAALDFTSLRNGLPYWWSIQSLSVFARFPKKYILIKSPKVKIDLTSWSSLSITEPHLTFTHHDSHRTGNEIKKMWFPAVFFVGTHTGSDCLSGDGDMEYREYRDVFYANRCPDQQSQRGDFLLKTEELFFCSLFIPFSKWSRTVLYFQFKAKSVAGGTWWSPDRKELDTKWC